MTPKYAADWQDLSTWLANTTAVEPSAQGEEWYTSHEAELREEMSRYPFTDWTWVLPASVGLTPAEVEAMR